MPACRILIQKKNSVGGRGVPKFFGGVDSSYFCAKNKMNVALVTGILLRLWRNEFRK